VSHTNGICTLLANAPQARLDGGNFRNGHVDDDMAWAKAAHRVDVLLRPTAGTLPPRRIGWHVGVPHLTGLAAGVERKMIQKVTDDGGVAVLGN
jgi:hypothetical protein